MQNLAFYRKYRPKEFDEIVGQDHVVGVLQNEAKSGRISHAYILAGSRGTGKTSVARIFAKELQTSSEDIYEMDAASNRGIDEIRAIRDAVHTYPYSSKYKIYIVDEAHMLTKEAWNAFLKTLEEPPDHVVFIMATTELHKVPDTVVSRCEVFSFKKPTHKALTDSVLKVAKAEKYSLEKRSASLIATLADGSFRDALSILQKTANSSTDDSLTHEEVERVLGAPKSSLIMDVIEAVAESDARKGLEAVRKASEQGTQMDVFLRMILRSLRFVLLLRFAKDMKSLVIDETGEEEFERLSAIAGKAKNVTSKTLIAFLDASSREAYSSIPELLIELAIVDACTQASQ
jgi:DNA polymerase-3 subunit gamma/tau